MLKALVYLLITIGRADSIPVFEMPEVIITASRIAQTAQRAVWPVEVLRVSSATDLAAALDRSAAADVRSYGPDGHSAFPMLAGVQASRVLLLSNTVPMNTRRDGVIDLSLIPLYPGDRIEVVRGPLSALYGSAAIGGVVNVLSVATDGIDASYEITNHLGMEAGASGGIRTEKLGWSAAGSWLSESGFRANDDVNRFGVKTSAWAAPFRGAMRRLRLGIDACYTWRELGIPGPQPDTADSSYVQPVFGNSLVTSLYDRQQDNLFSSGIKLDYNAEHFHTLLHLYGVAQRFSYDWRYQGLRSDWTPYTVLESDFYDDLRLGADLQLSADLTRNLLLTGGIAATSEMLSVTQVASDSTADTLVKNSSWGASDIALGTWVEAVANIRSFTSTLALRFDYSPQYGANISPEVGFSLSLIPERLTLKAAYGQAFRAPTFNDLYWPRDAYGGGDSMLVPERGQTASLTAYLQPISLLSVDLSGSWKDIRDMISWVPDSQGFWKPTNIDRASILGTDATMRFHLKDSLLIASAGVAYNYAQETRAVLRYYDWMTGETRTDTVTRQAAFVPPIIFKGNLQLRLWKGGSIEYSATWTDKRVNYYPDYTAAPVIADSVKSINPSLRMDLAVSQKFLKIVTCELGVRNLLNDRTPQQFGTSFQDLNYPTQPRSFYAVVSITYQ